jgi:beta-glucosidase
MQHIKQLISQMSLEEKAGMCSGLDFWRLKGVERLGIPSVMVTDGPHGLRKQGDAADHIGISTSVPATCFPSAAGLASTWNRELVRKVGVALGEECQAEDVAVLLGPGANIKRSPINGRNFEYFSEDPYQSSEIAASHIEGVQSQGVGTSLKHFAVNNQEHRRMSVDAVVDERTFREIYLASFEGAVKKSQPWTVMSAYNRVNGTYASENNRLLNEILRDEWGFEGVVVSDWGAVNELVDSVRTGMDLEMPSSNGEGDRKIVEAVQAGKLSEDVLDRTVERILTLIFRFVNGRKDNRAYDKDAHHALARETASESMVLLKNDGAVLPLNNSADIAVIGSFAKKPRYQGGGSSHIVPTKLDNTYDEIVRLSGKEVAYAEGYRLESDEIEEALLAEARQAAKTAQIAVIFAGLPDRYESEGYDRQHMRLPDNHLKLIEAVAEVQSNIVVVLSNGSPVEMPWIGKVKAVLEGYLGGQAAGGAIADLLFGEANPSGKLAETFPLELNHNPSYLNFPGEGDRVEYKEGLFVGYRYYEAKKQPTLFPFGHGLSYTTFAYSGLAVGSKQIKDTDTVEVSVNVKNTGAMAGKEIVQLYVRDVQSEVIRPVKELKGFAKVELQPGEERTVTFTLDKRSFAYYNVELKDWHVESGEFEIVIGRSSQDIALTETVHVESTVPIVRAYTRNATVGDMLANPATAEILRPLLQRFRDQSGFAAAPGDEHFEMMEAVMRYMPLRALCAFGNGAVTEADLAELLRQLNGLNEQVEA